LIAIEISNSFLRSRATGLKSAREINGGDLQTFPAFANTEGTKGCFDGLSATIRRGKPLKDQWLSTESKKPGPKRRTRSEGVRRVPALFFSPLPADPFLPIRHPSPSIHRTATRYGEGSVNHKGHEELEKYGRSANAAILGCLHLFSVFVSFVFHPFLHSLRRLG
jgi:hypothetical protein